MRLDPNVIPFPSARATLVDAQHALQRAGRRRDALEALVHVQAAIDMVDTAERLIVQVARAQGATWEQVGELYGVTRQAARQRFGVAGE